MRRKISRSPGRPRDDATGPALMGAARRLVIRDGYQAVSIGQIVAEAGVARQTLYRRWPGKAELVLDAFLESVDDVPVATGLPLEITLRRYLTDLFANLQTDGPAMRSLIASAQDDPKFLAFFRSRFIEPRARVVAEILEAAQQRAELSPNADVATASDALHGAFWYRLLRSEPLDAVYAERLAAFVVRGLMTV